MNTKALLPLVFLLIVSLTLGACSSSNGTQQNIVTEASQPTITPTPVKAVPLSATDFLANLNPDDFTLTADSLGMVMADPNNPLFILDVREPSELAADGFIPGSYNIPLKDVFNNLDKLPRIDKPIVVYCSTGYRGGMVMMGLRMLGYSNVLSLRDGMAGWMKAARNIDTGAPKTPAVVGAPEIDPARVKLINDFFQAMPGDLYSLDVNGANQELAGATRPLLIDVRTADQFSSAHVKDAVNIPLAGLLKDTSKLPADKTARLIVYGQNSNRGALAVMALRLSGYTNVVAMYQGFIAWNVAGLP